MNGLALAWVDTALALEQERDELEHAFGLLLEAYRDLAIAYDELRGRHAYEVALALYARSEIEHRSRDFPPVQEGSEERPT